MTEFYLSSRSEILRNVNMDTGRRIALVGAPEDFKVWMEKLLPRDTCIVDEPVGLAECTFFDIIIYWQTEELGLERLRRLEDILSDRGDLWTVVRHGPDRELLSKNYDVREDLVLNLTPETDLVPVIVRDV